MFRKQWMIWSRLKRLSRGLPLLAAWLIWFAGCANGGPRVDFCITQPDSAPMACYSYKNKRFSKPIENARGWQCLEGHDWEALFFACEKKQPLPDLPWCEITPELIFNCDGIETPIVTNFACLSKNHKARLYRFCEDR